LATFPIKSLSGQTIHIKDNNPAVSKGGKFEPQPN